MAQTNRQIAKDRLASTIGNDCGGLDTIDALTASAAVERITNTAANAAVAVTKFWSNPFPYSVLGVFRLNCDAAVAFNATNYASHIITVDDGANGSPVTAATFTTSTVNYAADTDASPTTSNTTNCVIPAGANVFYEVTQTAAGVALPVRMLKARFIKL